MKQVLPPGLSAAALDRALKDFARVVGDDWVFSTDLDRDTYLDHFAVDEAAHAPSAAVAPATAEQVQELLRVANRHKVPLWPISRGKCRALAHRPLPSMMMATCRGGTSASVAAAGRGMGS